MIMYVIKEDKINYNQDLSEKNKNFSKSQDKM